MKTNALALGFLTVSISAVQAAHCPRNAGGDISRHPEDDDRGCVDNNNCQLVDDCGQRWAQCGGIFHFGANCCQHDSTCKKWNIWFSQCVPNALLDDTEDVGVRDKLGNGKSDRRQQDLVLSIADFIKIVNTYKDAKVKDPVKSKEKTIENIALGLLVGLIVSSPLLYVTFSNEREAQRRTAIAREERKSAREAAAPVDVVHISNDAIVACDGKLQTKDETRNKKRWWHFQKKAEKNKASSDDERSKEDDNPNNEQAKGSSSAGVLLLAFIFLLAFSSSSPKKDHKEKETKKRRQK
ncbi:hypothetical protein AeMF1_015918 [Aphanomyces euteiches]|nr:hypothetical protein AeMF1_015918 [Aphanomyces euteiches]KAH9192514.1 hypothetical protein AeNC1_005504 [Aphanomyces euteiches]